MSKELSITANELDTLHKQAIDAKLGVETSVRSFLSIAIELGDLLTIKKEEIKETHGHGHWLTWLAENTQIEERDAQRYMKASRVAKTTRVSDLSLRQVVALCDKEEAEKDKEEGNPFTKPSLTEYTWVGKWRDNFFRKVTKTPFESWTDAMKQDLADTLAELNKVAARVGLTKQPTTIEV
jgi:hypothetical protein